MSEPNNLSPDPTAERVVDKWLRVAPGAFLFGALVGCVATIAALVIVWGIPR